jgi:hypothetical protein
MKHINAALLFIVVTVAVAAEPPDLTVTLDRNDTGKIYQGTGAVSGGGAIARLLFNYPEEQRSEILDYFFKPNFGASLNMLKVEIGGDGNSTEGSEPSHMHSRDDENYNRGFEWWMMKEAKSRNPDIKVLALAWDFPGWLKNANSQATADYLVKFIEGAKKTHDLEIDYIGIWNETKLDYEFIKRLSRTLKAHNLKTRILADDLVNTWGIVEAMTKDKELESAVDVINTHYPRFQSTEAAKRSQKAIWSGEDGPWNDDWATPGQESAPYAEMMNRNYIQGRITSTQIWCVVSAYYDILDIPNAGLLRAVEPWSGHYEVKSPIWVVAHTTQFAKPGWQYLDEAAIMFPEGGSMVALKDGIEYSVIVETLAATKAQKINFKIAGGLSTGPVHVWRTTANEAFMKIDDLAPVNGQYSLSVEPSAVYSLTTTIGQHKGHSDPPASKPFPMPYRDNFEQYEFGNTTAKYFIEQNGSYEVRECAGGREGKCLQQVINESPLVWTYGTTADLLGTASIIGDKNWSNYAVAADVLLKEPGYASVMGRISRVTLDGQISGYQLRLYDSGKWELRSNTGNGVVTSGATPCLLNTWHHLELSFDDSRIVAVIDGKKVGDVQDSTHTRGMAALGNAYNIGQYDNFEIRPLAPGAPVFAAERKVISTAAPSKSKLYAPTPLNQSVRLGWTKSEGAAGYKLVFGTEKGDYHSSLDVGAVNAYKVTALTNGITYYFAVVVYNSQGATQISNEVAVTPTQ